MENAKQICDVESDTEDDETDEKTAVEMDEDTWGLCDGLYQSYHSNQEAIIQTIVEKIYSNGKFEPIVTVTDNFFDVQEERREQLRQSAPVNRLCDSEYATWNIDDVPYKSETQDTIEDPIIGSRLDCNIVYWSPDTTYEMEIWVSIISRRGEKDVVCKDPQVVIDTTN